MTFLEASESVLRKVAEIKAQTAGFCEEPYSNQLEAAENQMTGSADDDLKAAALLDMAAAADVLSFAYCKQLAEKAGKGDPRAEEIVSGKYPEGHIRPLTREAQKALLEERAKFLGKQFCTSFTSDNGDYSPETGYESGRAVAEMYEWAALWFSHSGPGPYDDLPQWEREAFFLWKEARDQRLQVSDDMYNLADVLVHGKKASVLSSADMFFDMPKTPKDKIKELKMRILKGEETLKKFPIWTQLYH